MTARQIILLVLFACVFVSIGLYADLFSTVPVASIPPLPPEDQGKLEQQLTPIPVQPRPAVPHAVIPGGVQTPEELEHKKATDSVVRKHYKDLHATRATTTQKTQKLYASFRIGSAVCWTRRPITIKAGEPVLETDDPNVLVRVACGNQLRPHVPFRLRVGIPVPDNDRITTEIEQGPDLIAGDIPPLVDYYIPDYGGPIPGFPVPELPGSTRGTTLRLPPTTPVAGGALPPWSPFLFFGAFGAPVVLPWIPPSAGAGAIAVAATPEPTSADIVFIGFLLIVLLAIWTGERNRFG